MPFAERQYEKEKRPSTPSEYFSKLYPSKSDQFGTPFLETVHSSQFQTFVKPIAMNDLFFASILSDESLGHKTVFYDEQFYFKDVRDGGLFKPTTEDKLKNLLSLLILRCAESLPPQSDKLNLFVLFRQDGQLQRVVDKARSVLAAGPEFFALDSTYTRVGVDVQGKLIRTFISLGVEKNGGKSLTVPDAYTAFCEYCLKNGSVVVDRNVFESLMTEIVKREHGICLRHSVLNNMGKQQRGWQGIGLKEPVALLK